MLNGEIECCNTLIGTINGIGNITGTISQVSELTGYVSGKSAISGVVQVYNGTAPPDYEGAYEVTPTEYTQTLETAEKRLLRDVVINPIPNNYGLITWDGSTLTVS